LTPVAAIGTVLAGFRLESLIAEGATGAVYLATDTTQGTRAALKVLDPGLSADERFRRRFLRESELAANLHHPHVVPTLTSGEEDGVLYLAMPYIEGSDLRELLRDEELLEPERALDLVGQVAEALDAAHASGLVHRDVKPGNILIEAGPEGEHAYLCDFGLARHLSSPSSLTGDRGLIGTLDYIPPEQIDGRDIDGRADVYSLGCVLYECLTGERPFERDSELALIYAHLNDPPSPVTDLRPELPGAFDSVVATALAKAPDDRFSTCGALVEAAQAALGGKPYARRSRRRRRSVAVAVAVLVVAAVAVGGYLATRGEPSTADPPGITQTSIAGARLGLTEAAYKQQFGGYRQFENTEGTPPIPGLAFQQPGVAVYFRESAARADIITTWNRNLRTAAGIGPCSTLEDMKKAYGEAVKPSWFGTSPDGKKVFSWVVGRNLLFATQDQKSISTVALYEGSPADKPGNSGTPQSWANFVAATDTSCS
jgi:tRNA A-37 threonylcarbamoyl transferase component Bud32